MDITAAKLSDVSEASQSLAAAFAGDPLIKYLFSTHPEGSIAASQEFFSLLLRVRIALQMPALLLSENEKVLGAAMGYNTQLPKWPKNFESEWAELKSKSPGINERFGAYNQISDCFYPKEPHYYLGVLGIHPEAQGRGIGKMLLNAFCQLSSSDSLSTGVYLETANQDSLQFYYKCGFVLLGEENLDDFQLWCVFKPR